MKISPQPRKKWYERYHWFFSSNEILVTAGKNERNDRTILKRYVRPFDLIIGTDFGSPIAVVRNDNKILPLPAETIYEAVEFVVSLSEFWNRKSEEGSGFYVDPSQVSLNNNQISFVGKRKYLEKIKPRLSIAMRQEEVWKATIIYGPPTAVKKHSPYMVTLIPVDNDPKILAEELRKQLLLRVPFEIKSTIEAIDAKEFEKLIPFSKGQLVG